jgi:hypothetical protein
MQKTKLALVPKSPPDPPRKRHRPKSPADPPRKRQRVSSHSSSDMPDEHTHVGVSVVTFGFKHKSSTLITDADDEWNIVDLRENLVRDPANHVKHAEDGTCARCQQCVMSADGYETLMEHLLETTCLEKQYKVALGCTQGIHRADTTGRHLVSLLNSIVDDNGQRVYNAQHFPAGGLVPQHNVGAIIASAASWAEGPWCTMKAALTDDEVYGYDAACADATAFGPWRQCLAHRDARNNRVVAGGDREEIEPSPTLSEPAPASSSAKARDADWGASAYWKSKSWKSRDSKRSSDGEWSNRPDWATAEQDCKRWWEVLASYKVDITATQELFLLAQHSSHGHQAANAIIGKILKKASDGEWMNNISAFTHACVKRARHDLP